MSTLNQLLRAARSSEDCGLRLLDRRENESWVSWSEVYDRSRDVAGGLQSLGVEPGQTVALFYPTEAAFFFAFFGTLLAGGVPVPFYPPVRLGRLAEYQQRTEGMLRAVQSRVALCNESLKKVLEETLSPSTCRLLTVADLPTGGYQQVDVNDSDLAMVQFSSGTTVDPKPVALSHKAVVAQTRLLNGFWPNDAGVRHTGMCWLPLYHDMGLIGCVFPALERPTVLTLMGPETFVARPAMWLRAISRYRATVSPAPNFAYRHCVDHIKDSELDGVDLSCWQVALNGAEAVVPNVLRAFIDKFARWGFRPEAMTPVYGLSEASLAVTFSEIGKPFTSQHFDRTALQAHGIARAAEGELELVSVGRPLPGFKIEIRDTVGNPLGENQVGHIWTTGPSLMDGYLHKPQATAAAIQNGWLNTGDLGFMHDGQLYISGRAKDVLIVRGFNHAPEEIEMVVDDLPNVRAGGRAAVNYMPPGAEREEVWLLIEKQRKASDDATQSMASECMRAVLAHTGIQLDRVEIFEGGSLPRTSSGKIRRAEALRQFLAGELLPAQP